MSSLPSQLPQLTEVVRGIEQRHLDRVERVYARDYLAEARDYLSGRRSTLAPAEMIVALVRDRDAEHARAESFRKSCMERDAFIAFLLGTQIEGEE